MAALRQLVGTPHPLRRCKALQAIGLVEPVQAALDLVAMARDADLPAVARVRCAEAAVELTRDVREQAAVGVRAVARDGSVPRHVRRLAARDLARWSELCRDEARALLAQT